MRLYAAPLQAASSDSNPLARLDFFDADGRLVARDVPPLKSAVPSTWRACSIYPTGTRIG
jgi:hypothetical protein